MSPGMGATELLSAYLGSPPAPGTRALQITLRMARRVRRHGSGGAMGWFRRWTGAAATAVMVAAIWLVGMAFYLVSIDTYIGLVTPLLP